MYFRSLEWYLYRNLDTCTLQESTDTCTLQESTDTRTLQESTDTCTLQESTDTCTLQESTDICTAVKDGCTLEECIVISSDENDDTEFLVSHCEDSSSPLPDIDVSITLNFWNTLLWHLNCCFNPD
jgi:hypothetical protein